MVGKDVVVPRPSHPFVIRTIIYIFFKTCQVGFVFFKVNGINQLEQLTGGLWGAGKDLVVPRQSHTFFFYM